MNLRAVLTNTFFISMPGVVKRAAVVLEYAYTKSVDSFLEPVLHIIYNLLLFSSKYDFLFGFVCWKEEKEKEGERLVFLFSSGGKMQH